MGMAERGLPVKALSCAHISDVVNRSQSDLSVYDPVLRRAGGDRTGSQLARSPPPPPSQPSQPAADVLPPNVGDTPPSVAHPPTSTVDDIKILSSTSEASHRATADVNSRLNYSANNW